MPTSRISSTSTSSGIEENTITLADDVKKIDHYREVLQQANQTMINYQEVCQQWQLDYRRLKHDSK